MNSLTDKQQKFCNEYLLDLNATQAAIRAGYSENTASETGYENLRKPQIATCISELMEERNKRTQIDADWVLQAQKEVYDVAMGIKPTKVLVRDSICDGMTEHVVHEHHKHDLSAANKALETIGKHVNVQAWKEKIDHQSSDCSFKPSVIQLVGIRPDEKY